MDIFKEFHEKGVVNKNKNNTFIALISKRKDYSKPKDFRPISLSTFIYKIITKTLANRLRPTLASTVSENQLAFVHGYQITHAILMSNEEIDFWKANKTKEFVLKLDIEKAFDKPNWNFIQYILEKKNFPITWRNWIKGCITNVNYSVIINVKPQGRTKANRGLRQGDPIFPFLFVIAMDYPSRLLIHLESIGSIRGAFFNNSYSLSHILFSDDILLFVEDNDCYIKNLLMAIKLFKKALGLNVDLTKSIICPINASQIRTKEVTQGWNIPCQDLSLSCLGVTLGDNPNSKSFWSNIEIKIQKKAQQLEILPHLQRG
ncbi:LINE-1 retrotransposable element ORF2 protein [Cucumis melo var. makuwa]|uniref:LINE-1 retrotransposable element ORF2 protein n=1 Tax=Cucumis melo var. makuwa TaxID=1194695 RepID=A0A5D3CQS9_CUCMM|nr:LINE-1 retrotransposable element ORF2 protein [Cucumis melo var. makuwa]TYK14277.1 LINE-1 retrotransposable element ORF2 protein [Cucumis melo var. makuwa]